MRPGSSVRGVRGGTVGHGRLGDRGRSGLSVQVRNAVGTRRRAVGVGVMALEGIRMAVLTAHRLRHVRHHLHATGHGAGGATAAGGIGGGRGTAEAFRQLLDQGHGDVVGGDVHGIGHAQDHQRPLGGQGKAGVGGVEPRAGRFLDLTDPAPTLANDRTNEKMRNQQTQGICLGLGSGGRIKGLVVQGTDDQTKGLVGQSC